MRALTKKRIKFSLLYSEGRYKILGAYIFSSSIAKYEQERLSCYSSRGYKGVGSGKFKYGRYNKYEERFL